MSWDGYIDNLLVDTDVMDAAIAGCESGSESLWAASKKQDAQLKDIQSKDIKALVSSDRSSLFSKGVSLAGMSCTVLRDALLTEGSFTMDLRTKATSDSPDTFSICIGKSNKALVIVKGGKGVHGGKVNKKAFDMAEYLRKSGY